MKYRMLQVGEVIKEGDQYLNLDERVWKKTFSQGTTVQKCIQDAGIVYRRPECRDLIEVVGADDNEPGVWVTADSPECGVDGRLYVESDDLYVGCPLTYAQKLIDAIREVAGI